MEEYSFEYFPARYRAVRLLPMFLGLLFFLLMGVFAILTSHSVEGIAAASFGLLLFLAAGLQNLPGSRKYGIGKYSLILKARMTKRELDISDIKWVSAVSRKELRGFLENLYRPVVEAEKGLEFFKWIKASKSYGEVTGFMSVAPIMSEIRRGGPIDIRSYGVNAGSDAVILNTANGYYIITPKDPAAFTEKLEARGIDIRTSESIAETVFPEEFRENIRNIQPSSGIRKLMRVNFIITFVIAAGLVIYFGFLRNAGDGSGEFENRSGVESEYIEPSGAYGVWEGDSDFFFGVDAELIPDEVTLVRDELTAWPRSYAVEAMARDFADETGADLSVILRSEKAAELADFLWLHSQIRYQENITNDAGREFAVFICSGSEIGVYIKQEFKRISGE